MSRHRRGSADLPTGQVVPFPSRATLPSRPGEPGAKLGQILLFTGIRYERHDAAAHRPASLDDHHPAPAGAGRRGPRRRA